MIQKKMRRIRKNIKQKASTGQLGEDHFPLPRIHFQVFAASARTADCFRLQELKGSAGPIPNEPHVLVA
jgi:hypothetical protein